MEKLKIGLVGLCQQNFNIPLGMDIYICDIFEESRNRNGRVLSFTDSFINFCILGGLNRCKKDRK